MLFYSGATHKFIKKEVVKRFNLQIEPKTNSFKAINSGFEKVVGLTQQVPLKLGEWIGMSDFTVVPLDDFGVVLRQEFMKKEKVVPMPHFDGLAFISEKTQYSCEPQGEHQGKGRL